ncbi:MAG: hypothetical protein JWO33_2095 [Caulobacteraceae bacterium]|nr:hypothetical protein [Caulobacteraceae bacterium]
MPAYRLYFLGDDGHIVSAVELDCVDDRQAISQAGAHADGRAVELWERARKIEAPERKTG